MAATLELGRIRITHVRAGTHWWDGGAFFGVVPRTLWARNRAVDDLNRIEAAFNCFLIQLADRNILVETGGGIRHDPRWRERTRMDAPIPIRDALTQSGFDPDSIDTVINTHLHWDHASGNTIDVDGIPHPAFPNARYFVQRKELLHAREQHPRDAVSYIPVNYEPLVASGHMHLLDGDYEPAPGIQIRVTPGHNRDMAIVLAKSEGQTWCHLADLAPYAAQITPTWVAAFDLYPLETIANKQQILTRAANEDWWLSFGHDPAVAFAQISLSDNKFRLR